MIDVCRHCNADIKQIAFGVWTCVPWGISTCEIDLEPLSDGVVAGEVTHHAPIPSTPVEIEEWLAS